MKIIAWVLDGLLVGEFAPGSGAVAYPGDQNLAFGMDFPAGSNVILAMHYPVGSLGITDSTKVHFYFYPNQINNFRQIEISPILVDFNFCVPPNQQKTISNSFTVPMFAPSLSMYGVFPHMHLIGKSISTDAILPNHDTLKLINIPDWDFEWQGSYSFPKMLKIPPMSQIVGTATYDNTVGNPHNPNTPPQTICAGFNTTDEMFVIYYLYTMYQSGDENLNLDSLMANGMVDISELNLYNNQELEVFPNPSNGMCTVDLLPFKGSTFHFEIFDLNGRIVYREKLPTSLSTTHTINLPNKLANSTYILKVNTDLEEVRYGKIILK